jgi:hypothetical protein
MMQFGSGNDEDSLLLLKGVRQLIPCVIAALSKWILKAFKKFSF